MFDSFERIAVYHGMNEMIDAGLISSNEASIHYSLLFFMDGTEQ